MRDFLKKFGGDAKGATAVEYGLVVALIVIAVVASINTLGGRTGSMWSNMTNKVAAVTPNA